MSRIEQSGRSSLRRPKLPTKGGSAPKEEEEEKEVSVHDINGAANVKVFNTR